MTAAAVTEFETVVFDLDGVLVDTTPCHSSAYDALWRRIGIEGPSYASIAGRPTREAVVESTLQLRPTAEEILEWTRLKQSLARSTIASSLLLFPDSVRCLRALDRRGIRLALATAASRATTEIVLQRFDLGGWFAAVVTGDEVTHGKPSPDVYRQAIGALAADPGRTLAVEDSLAGLEAAASAGAAVVSVRTGATLEHPSFRGSFPDLDGFMRTFAGARP